MIAIYHVFSEGGKWLGESGNEKMDKSVFSEQIASVYYSSCIDVYAVDFFVCCIQLAEV